jgi:hypothetical protein
MMPWRGWGEEALLDRAGGPHRNATANGDLVICCRLQGGSPQIRLLALIEYGTHAVIDAGQGACRERSAARY